MYSSQWGRFTSPDPYANSVALNDPTSWNRYAYARADPVNHFDPSGLDDEPPFACDLFGGCHGCPTDWGDIWDGFIATPSPYGPVCPQSGSIMPVLGPGLPQFSINCMVTLMYRPVEPNPQPGVLGLALESANHAYIDVKTFYELLYQGTAHVFTAEFVMEGMPQYPTPNATRLWGNLEGVQETVYNGEVAGDPKDHPATDPKFGSYAGPGVCAHVSALEAAAAAFPKNVPYFPVPEAAWLFGITGENSNFYAWSLLTTAGLGFAAPPDAPGWPGSVVPF